MLAIVVYSAPSIGQENLRDAVVATTMASSAVVGSRSFYLSPELLLLTLRGDLDDGRHHQA